MLHLTGTLRAAQQIGGGVNRKTGEAIPLRCVLQIEDLDDRGLVDLYTITVPDLEPYKGAVGGQVTVPVRAWAVGTKPQFAFAE